MDIIQPVTTLLGTIRGWGFKGYVETEDGALASVERSWNRMPPSRKDPEKAAPSVKWEAL